MTFIRRYWIAGLVLLLVVVHAIIIGFVRAEAARIKVTAGGVGMFTLRQDGQGPGVFTDPAFAVNTTQNSFRPGDVAIAWVTGLGPRSPDDTPTPGWQQVTMALAGRLGDSGSIALDVRRPGSSLEQRYELPVSNWHRGVDEPDLLGSLGIEPSLPPVVGEVLPDGPASRAGFRAWDRVVAVDGDELDTWVQWVEAVQQAPERALRVTVDREGSMVELTVLPDSRSAAGDTQIGYVGLAPHTNDIRYGPIEAVARSLGETGDKTLLTLGLLKKMVTGDVSMKNLSGPITIAKVAGDSARSGWRFFFSVLALLSISLGVLNLLPIPILDGGHILFCAVEAVTGRPVSENAQAIGTQVGLFLVAGLMILALYNDISRLF